ncbi:MAG: MMPL family transporter [Planctomycetes bacterium]|nr:MMPL family transporter [Planctomycetota bacterium]
MNETFFGRHSLRILVGLAILLPFVWMGTRRALESNHNEVADWLPAHNAATQEHAWFKEHFPHEKFVLVSWEGCTLGDPRLDLLGKKLVELKDGQDHLFHKYETGATLLTRLLCSEHKDLSEETVRHLLRLFDDVVELARLYGKEDSGDISEEGVRRWLDTALAEAPDLQRRLEVEPSADGDRPLRRQLAALHDRFGQLHEQLRAENAGRAEESSQKSLREMHRWVGDTLHDSQQLSAPLDAQTEAQVAMRLRGIFQSLAVVCGNLEDALIAREETPSADAVREALAGAMKQREVMIARLKGSLIGDDHRTSCLIVTLSKAAGKKNLRPTVERLRQVAADECAIGPDKIRLGGPPVDNVAIDVEGERTLFKLAWLSGVVGLGISWLCFRSIRLTIIVFSCGIFAAGIGLALVFFTGDTVDAVLLSMPSLVYVLALSGAIHIVNYYHEAIDRYGLERAPGQAIKDGWVPCTLAALTTALGLGSLCVSELVPIEKFGKYSAFGVVATLGLLFLFLPACLQLWPSRDRVRNADQRRDKPAETSPITDFWLRLGGFVVRRNGLVAIACALVMACFVFGLATRTKTTIKLMKLFSSDAEIIHHYTWLEDNLGPLVPLEVVVKVDPDECSLSTAERVELVKSIEEAVEGLDDEVGGALSVATFAPDMERLAEKNRFRPRGLLGALARAGGLNEQTPDMVLRRRLHDELPDYLTVDRQTGDELWRVSVRVRALSDVDYGQYIHVIESTVNGVLLDRDGNPRFAGVEAKCTGLVPLVYKSQTKLMEGLVNSLALAFVLIAVVMMLVLRSPLAGGMAMIPNMFPVVIIFGGMAWLGIAVDIGAMMTASVALGVAVDDTIHYLTWFRRGLDREGSRRRAALSAYGRCATAMTQTTLIGGLGLAVFAFSSFTPTERFGVLMLTLLATALVGDLIFLPALLCGPLGRFFGRRGTMDGRGEDSLDESATAEDSPIKKFPVISAPEESGNGDGSPQETPSRRRLRSDRSHRSRRLS